MESLITETRHFFRSSIRQSTHFLRASDPDSYFLDFDSNAAEPSRLRPIIDLFAERIATIRDEKPIDYLLFMDKGSSGYGGSTTGAIVLASALSLRASLPYALLRLDKEARADRIKAPACSDHQALTGQTGLLITDHVTTGSEILDAAQTVRRCGGQVSDCVAYSCRTDRLRSEDLDAAGLRLHYFHPFPETARQLELSLTDDQRA